VDANWNLSQKQTMKKLTDDQLERVVSLIEEKLHTIGCVEFMLVVRPYFKGFLALASLIMLVYIYLYSASLWLFFLPLIPIVSMNLIEWIDLNIIVYSLGKIHNELIQEEIMIDWNTLFEITVMQIENKTKHK
jgi:hypothetical protein